jgi:hypothetical protein
LGIKIIEKYDNHPEWYSAEHPSQWIGVHWIVGYKIAFKLVSFWSPDGLLTAKLPL